MRRINAVDCVHVIVFKVTVRDKMASVDGGRYVVNNVDNAAVQCDPCRHGGVVKVANTFCHQCDKYMCTICKAVHQGLLRDHTLDSLDSGSIVGSVDSVRIVDSVDSGRALDSGDSGSYTQPVQSRLPIGSKLALCDEHKDKNIRWFCVPHEVMLCDICKRIGHRKCEVTPISDMVVKSAHVKQLAAVMESTAALKLRIGNLKTARENCVEDLEKLKHSLEEEVKQFKSRLIETIERMEREMLDDLNRVLTEEVGAIRDHIETCEYLIPKLETELNIADEAKSVDDHVINVIAAYRLSQTLDLLHPTVSDMENDVYTVHITFQPSTPLVHVATVVDRLGTLAIDRAPTADVDILAIDSTPTADVDTLAIDRAPTVDVDILAIDSTPTADVDILAIDRAPTADLDILAIDSTPTADVDTLAIDRAPTADVDILSIGHALGAFGDTYSIGRAPTADVDTLAIGRTPTADVGTLAIDRTPTTGDDTTTIAAGPVRPGSGGKSWWDMDVESSADINVPSGRFTGVTVMPDGRIILVSGRYVILLDRHLAIQNTLALPSRLWDVAADGNENVIVSMQSSEQLQWFGVTPGLHAGLTIYTSMKHTRGIAVHGGYIYLCGYMGKFGGGGQVQVLDRDGTVVRQIAVDSTGKGMLASPLYVAVSPRGDVYVTEYATGRITCYSKSGYKIYGALHRDMRVPRGMVADDNCLLVCCKGSNNIQTLGKDGVRRKVMLSSVNGVAVPFAMAYRQTDNMLIVTTDGTPNVRVYKLK